MLLTTRRDRAATCHPPPEPVRVRRQGLLRAAYEVRATGRRVQSPLRPLPPGHRRHRGKGKQLRRHLPRPVSGQMSGTDHPGAAANAPRSSINHRDTKGAFISFTKPMEPDEVDLLIPEDSVDGNPTPVTMSGPGEFLDLPHPGLRPHGGGPTPWTGPATPLASPGKSESGEHGVITEHYVDYCRQDVAATVGLYEALMAEFALPPHRPRSRSGPTPQPHCPRRISSPWGSHPILDRHPDSHREVLGYAMAAFFGGGRSAGSGGSRFPSTSWTSLRCTPRSMPSWTYTGSSWPGRSRSSTVQERNCHVRKLTVDDCFDPEFWPLLVGFGLVHPQGDVLPLEPPTTVHLGDRGEPGDL